VIDLKKKLLNPKNRKSFAVEGAGGVFVPLN
jgi:dethiobiotin synthetase